MIHTTRKPMNTTVIINRRELEYSVSGLMHPQYPAPDIKHLIDRLHTKDALRLEDLELSGMIELFPGCYMEAAGAHTEGSMNEIHANEPRVTGNHGVSKREEKAAIKKLLASSKFLLPVHDKPAKIAGAQLIARMDMAVPGPVVQSLPTRNWFPM